MDQDRMLWVFKKMIYFFEISFCFCIEVSHRSATFGKIIQDAERDIREIL